MRIQRLHIDRFGILTEQDIPNISPGISVFIGHNEAGKSTCLHFLRAMLFGYKRGRSSIDPMPEKRTKAVSGGSIFMQTEAIGDITLTRRPGKKIDGDLSLLDSAGQPLPESELLRLFSGMTVDVFDNIFAVSLEKIMALASLNSENVRHALHGAAFGLGLQSPAKVIHQLESRMAPLLKRDHASALINNSLHRLEEVQAELRERGPDMERYAQLQHSLELVEERLASLSTERDAHANEHRRICRRLAVWQQWESVQRIRAERASLEQDNAISFTPDSLQRLESTLIQREERLFAVRGEEQTLSRLTTELATFTSNPSLARIYPRVQQLREQKDRCRGESVALPSLERGIVSLAAQQQEVLTRLGPGWDAAAVAKADTSLFTQEAIHRHAHILEQADEGVRLARREYSRISAEHAEAVHRNEQANASLKNVPKNALPLPDNATAEGIAAQLVHAQSILGELPALLKRRHRTEQQATLSLMEVNPQWQPQHLAACDISAPVREGIREDIARLAATRTHRTNAMRTLEDARAALGECEEKVALTAQCLAGSENLPEPEELELRRLYLRRIERVVVELATARRSMQPVQITQARNSAKARLALGNPQLSQSGNKQATPQYTTLFPSFGLGLLLFGVLLIVCGNAKFLAAHITSFTAIETFFTQVGISANALCWAGGVFVLSGLIICAISVGAAFASRARDDSARAHATNDIMRLQERLHTLSAVAWLRTPNHAGSNTNEEKTATNTSKIVEGLDAASLLLGEEEPELTEGDLNRAALHLEQQARRRIFLEREIQEHNAALAAAATANAQLQRAVNSLEAVKKAYSAAIAALRNRLLQASLPDPFPTLPTENATQPETSTLDLSVNTEIVASLSTQVETARTHATTAREAATALLHALNSLIQPLRQAEHTEFFTATLQQSRGQQTWQDFVETLYNSPSTALEGLSPINQGLATLSRAMESLRLERTRMQERQTQLSVLTEREEAATRATMRLNTASNAVTDTQNVHKSAITAWQSWLNQHNLAPTLSPQVATEAFHLMLTFEERQKNIAEQKEKYAATRHELEQFIIDVASLAHTMHLPLPAGIATPTITSTDSSTAKSAPTLQLPHNGVTLLPEILLLLDSLAEKSEEAVKVLALHAAKQEQITLRADNLLGAQTALTATENSLAELFDKADVPDAESFRATFARWQQSQALLAEERTLLAGIHALAAEEGSTEDAVLASLQGSRFDDLEALRGQLEQTLPEMEATLKELAEERGQLKERRDALAGGEGNAPLHREEAILREELRSLSRQWCIPALARRILLTAKARFEQEGQKSVIGYAGKLFADITQGEYTGIATSLDGEGFSAIHKSGEARNPEGQLSQGTREQLYLALRLAYISSHAAKAEPLPVIMDDILVNFDPQRAKNCAATLARFAATNQILFFTCHPHTADMLMEAAVQHSPAPALFTIRQGEVTCAPAS